ncbi:vitellogenin-A2-like [Notechis scutatus]|uniref:Vitellogenin-A2-like n=1 Tax=Notechis scutatus TaxID=8663 RepID=A0A6J1VXY6_9SAUR|nr:vitellogenin-A2-like [Notechis scutatus]
MDPKAKTSTIADIPKLLFASQNGICTVESRRILNFNKKLITKGLPDDCFINVLGDCTCHKKLIVLMKYETAHNNSLLVEIHTQDIICTMKQRDGELILEVNGTRLQDGVIPRSLKHVPLQFKETKSELDFRMPLVGLENVLYTGYNVKFEVNPSIENSCGICGWYGSEAKALRRPSGHIARDEVSFVQSWVVPDKCGGDCKLRHTTVRHENPILMEQCATNLPVARCAEGCSATSTTQTLASFHCVPTGSTLPSDLTVLAEKSDDMIDLVESHTSCSCEQEQCAA